MASGDDIAMSGVLRGSLLLGRPLSHCRTHEASGIGFRVLVELKSAAVACHYIESSLPGISNGKKSFVRWTSRLSLPTVCSQDTHGERDCCYPLQNQRLIFNGKVTGFASQRLMMTGRLHTSRGKQPFGSLCALIVGPHKFITIKAGIWHQGWPESPELDLKISCSLLRSVWTCHCNCTKQKRLRRLRCCRYVRLSSHVDSVLWRRRCLTKIVCEAE
jgi:hypothetical protein